MITRASAALLLVTLGRVFPDRCAGAGLDQSPSRDSRWISDSDLRTSGFGRVTFEARDGNRLDALIYRSGAFDPAHGPIWFVMHGASRDAGRYIRAAAPVAERYDALAIVIHFSEAAYPTSADYTLGVTTSRGWRAPADMLYAEVERAFDLVRGSLGGQQTGYHLFGHSAGAQFTHRLLTFLPAPRVRSAVAANAGWYTLPTDDDPRRHAMPYGLRGGPVEPRQLTRFFGTRFTVLLGEADTATAASDDLLRGTPEAEAQGRNRLERGRHYFAMGRAQAAALGAPFQWRLEVAPRVGHDAARMIASAGFLSFVPDAVPCTTAADHAPGVVITEILADPPAGDAGDANHDGVRHPQDDEFVELVNRGTAPVCLAGWALGDAANSERHVFPHGPALEPGEILVVFGGGVPTGTFAGAAVQTAAEGLSLQAAGDVVTLRDARDVVVHQVSWGDCAGARCGQEHWAAIAHNRYSPGIAAP
jgi:hypothetical protein